MGVYHFTKAVGLLVSKMDAQMKNSNSAIDEKINVKERKN
jgi:hypothetical protein